MWSPVPDLVVARAGVVQAARTGRDKPVPYNARAGTVHEFDAGRNLFHARSVWLGRRRRTGFGALRGSFAGCVQQLNVGGKRCGPQAVVEGREGH